MPDVSGTKISALDTDSNLNDSDYLAGVDANASPIKTKKFTLAALKTFFKSGLTKSDVGLDNVANVLQYSASNKPTAADVTYDGTTSGLSATDAKGAIDELASEKQEKITASGILKGNGSGGVSAASAGTDYQAPVKAGTMALSTSWTQSGDAYTQTATITGVTVADGDVLSLLLTDAQLDQLLDDGVCGWTIANVSGTVTVTMLEAAPSVSLTIAVMVIPGVGA